ncbi:MAG TPA: hypothetical protein VF760_05670, partial [Xanthobacteraceae bacterium]
PEHRGSVGGSLSFSFFYDPGIGSTVETDLGSAEPLISRDADFLKARSVVVRQFFAGKRALQQTAPFRLEAGLGATLHGKVETHL